MKRQTILRCLAVSALLVLSVSLAVAQDATVKVRVSPPEAYIFVDGQPFAHRSQTISVPMGKHTIGVYNYGFVPQVQEVDLVAGKNPEIVARLEAVPGMVQGPWGRIQIEGNANDKAAVFINEQKPDFFIGHVDEMNNEKVATQKAILPVGTYKLIIVNPKETEPVFADSIEVRADQRLVVDIAKNTREYHGWHKASHHTERARFQTSGNTASIAVAPVTGNLTVDKTMIKCGDTIQLSWTSTEAAETTLAASPQIDVPKNGQRTDMPLKDTTYTFEAKGPGGTVDKSVFVHVDPTVQVGMKANPAEVHYRKIDDKIVDPGNYNLQWTTDNAQAVKIDPLGTVSTQGDRTLAATPKKTDIGVVDEVHTYVLTATNNCGGIDKTLAAVHITGTIEPLPVVPLTSIFFPTAYPTPNHPEIGLLTSQKELLFEAVTGYKQFLEYDPDTKIRILANTDVRAKDDYNMALSERRAKIVKDELVALGVNEAKIEIVAQGETQPFDRAKVKELEATTNDPRPATTALVHAYNRRVDLVMVPTTKPEQLSKQVFPHEEKDARLLKTDQFVGTKRIEKASAPYQIPGSASGQH